MHQGGLKDRSQNWEGSGPASLLPCLHGAWSASSYASYGASDGRQGGTVGGAHGGDALVGGVHGGAALAGGARGGDVPAGRGQMERGHRDSHLGVPGDRSQGCQAALEGSQGRDLPECQDQGIQEEQVGKFGLGVVAPLQVHLGRRGESLASRAGLFLDRQCGELV